MLRGSLFVGFARARTLTGEAFARDTQCRALGDERGHYAARSNVTSAVFILAWSLSAGDVLALLPLLALGAGVYALVLLGWLTHKLAKPPRRTFAVALAQGRPADPSQLPEALAFREFSFACDGLSLSAWEVTGKAPGGPTCVLTHGFGDSKLGGLSRVPALAACCSRLVLWDMPGHGESPGSCAQGTSEVLALRALLAALPRDAQGERGVVLYGWSMGAGVSIACAGLLLREAKAGQAHMGEPHPPRVRGIIAESPYRLARTPAENVLRVSGLPRGMWLRAALGLIGASHRVPRELSLKDEAFDRAAWATRLQGVPLLVLHGSDDHVSPIEDGRAISQAAQGELHELAGGGHFGLWTDSTSAASCALAAQQFVRRVSSDAGSAAE
jgi:pimeloyl-ACP methyl ester carboxylesterase